MIRTFKWSPCLCHCDKSIIFRKNFFTSVVSRQQFPVITDDVIFEMRYLKAIFLELFPCSVTQQLIHTIFFPGTWKITKWNI